MNIAKKELETNCDQITIYIKEEKKIHLGYKGLLIEYINCILQKQPFNEEQLIYFHKLKNFHQKKVISNITVLYKLDDIIVHIGQWIIDNPGYALSSMEDKRLKGILSLVEKTEGYNKEDRERIIANSYQEEDDTDD